MKLNRPLTVLALAVLAGLLAVAFTARWLQTRHAQGVPVVVADRDLPLGTPLEVRMLTTVTWPTGAVPEGVHADPGALVGRVLRTSVGRHEPLLEARLAPIGARAGLSAALSPGKRALTVKVNEVVGVAGFALPGSVVDVMVHTTRQGAGPSRQNGDQAVSRIVLERILVLAVAQESGRDSTAPRVASAVTLEVSPEEAERLDLARSIGSLSLVLRNPADLAPAGTAGAAKCDLLGGVEGCRDASANVAVATAPPPSARPAPKAPPASSRSPARNETATEIEVLRGLARSRTDVPSAATPAPPKATPAPTPIAPAADEAATAPAALSTAIPAAEASPAL